MANRVLLIGRGQVGSGLLEVLQENYEVINWQGDIANVTIKDLQTYDPIAVINAAGKTDLAWCEAYPHETFRSNVEAPFDLYKLILSFNKGRNANVKYIHCSSGCVWDGPYDEEGNPFTPESPVSPAAFYSWTKASCDAMLLTAEPLSVAVLRPRQVYSAKPSSRNSLIKLLKYPNLIDTPNSMSSLEVIGKTVLHLLEAQEDWSGIWNIYDKGVTTPYKIGLMLHEAGLRSAPNVIQKSELDQWHKPRRVDTVLYDSRFEKYIAPRSIEEVLTETISALKTTLEPTLIT